MRYLIDLSQPKRQWSEPFVNFRTYEIISENYMHVVYYLDFYEDWQHIFALKMSTSLKVDSGYNSFPPSCSISTTVSVEIFIKCNTS